MIFLLASAWAVDLNDTAEYRLIFSLPPDPVLDSEGTRADQKWMLDQRLRLGLDLSGKTWYVGTEWDLLNGQFAGDTWKIPGTEDERHREAAQSFSLAGIRPRKGVVGFDLPVGKLDIGLQTSNWGLGMVANDGNGDPLFGRSDFGDRVIRARFATRLKTVTLLAAADLVAADDTADLLQHQAAIQGVLAGIYRPMEILQLGLYGVYRHQIEGAFQEGARKETSDLGVMDFYGHYTPTLARWSLDLGLEAAGIYGRTTRARSYTSVEGLDVLSGGIAAKARIDHPSQKFGAFVGGGFLSGDGNPDDGATHAFSADRDFDVGMVLFDEVQGNIDAATYAQLSNPEYSGQPPDGADAIVSEGAVRGATWVQPAVLVTPLPWMQARVGVVMAWSTAPVSQSFQTFRHGGVPTNHLGQETTGYSLGTELDWALEFGRRTPLSPSPFWTSNPEIRAKDGDQRVMTTSPYADVKLKPTLILQGGHAWLSEDKGGGRADLVMAVGRLRL